MKFKHILFVTLTPTLFFHCGTNPNAGQKASNSIQTLEKDISTKNCNGKGTAFSGTYQVSAKPGKAKCDGEEAIDLTESEFELDCAQNDQEFACKISDYTWKGCINQDGSFVMGVKENANYMKDVMKLTEDASNIQAIGKMAGKIQGDSGEGAISVAILAVSGHKKKGCTGSWPVSIQLGQKADNIQNPASK